MGGSRRDLQILTRRSQDAQVFPVASRSRRAASNAGKGHCAGTLAMLALGLHPYIHLHSKIDR